MTREELKARRIGARVSRYDLAAEMGTNYSFLQRVEEGWRDMPEDFAPSFIAALARLTARRHETVVAPASPVEAAR